MTDKTVQRAEARLSGDRIDIDAAIECGGDRISYAFFTFDKAGKPAPMLGSSSRVRAHLRIDDAPPVGVMRTGVLNRLDVFGTDTRLPNASRLTLRLYLPHGEETLQIDQTDTALKPMLNECARRLPEPRVYAPRAPAAPKNYSMSPRSGAQIRSEQENWQVLDEQSDPVPDQQAPY
jgi:hypothetical protein